MMKNVAERTIAQGQWLALKETTLETDDGKRFLWESVDRVKSKHVAIVYARLVPSDRIVLISQYRPVIENRVIALPAGFVDSGTVESEALRELLEETGYTGVVKSVSPLLVVNSALITDRLQVVEAEIDENDPRNASPRQHLEISEDIETHLVPRKDVRAFLTKKIEEGCEVGSGVWYMFGMSEITQR
jgi:ADP-ribose pyrophosphatase YjhB (NUDIX family)